MRSLVIVFILGKSRENGPVRARGRKRAREEEWEGFSSYAKASEDKESV
jgi:hypothetical protein